ncbi:MAG TPA: hypothetical protein VF783_13645 [Terriglobales bacterium]
MARTASSTPNSVTTKPNVMMMRNRTIENEVAAVHAKASICVAGILTARSPRGALARNRDLGVYDPGNHTAQKAVSFPHPSQTIEAVARNQATLMRGSSLAHAAICARVLSVLPSFTRTTSVFTGDF